MEYQVRCKLSSQGITFRCVCVDVWRYVHALCISLVGRGTKEQSVRVCDNGLEEDMWLTAMLDRLVVSQSHQCFLRSDEHTLPCIRHVPQLVHVRYRNSTVL